MLGFLLLVASAAATRASGKTTVSDGVEPMKLSSTGPSSTLPSFFFMARSEEGGALFGGHGFQGGTGTPSAFHAPVTGCPDEIYENESPDLRVPQLPWRVQNDWGCERVPTPDVPVVVMENDYLRAAITPQWGSKIWSLFHKKEKRQLIFNNPAHQPANIGYRKAWSSGGMEWNWAPGKIGHSVFTESPTFLAKLETERGTVVRAWEYDRQNHTVWSVDILLEEDTLWVHPRVYNKGYNGMKDDKENGPREVPGYWWTCVAMSATDTTRIVTPAQLSMTPCTPWPYGAWTQENVSFRGSAPASCSSTPGSCAYQDDNSYIGNLPRSHDFFFYIERNVSQPHVTHISDDNYTFVHSHASRVRGTKFFQWGMDSSGTFQQDFLSASDYENEKCTSPYYDPWCDHYEHEGRYTELQVGPAPTQMHTFPVSANSTFEWTEWFKGTSQLSDGHHQKYSKAVDEVNGWIKSKDGVPLDHFEEMDAFFETLAKTPVLPENMIYQGMPWGGLHEMLLAEELGLLNKNHRDSQPPTLVPYGACPFPKPKYNAETRAWMDLLVNGTFSNDTLHASTPVTFMIDSLWVKRLQASADKSTETWLHGLYLGTYELETGNVDDARASFKRSISLQPSAHAYRNLATFAETVDEGASLYQKAWSQWELLLSTRRGQLSSQTSNIVTEEEIEIVENLGKDLSGEIAAWLMLNERWLELDAFVTKISKLSPPSLAKRYLEKDRLLHARASLALQPDGLGWKVAENILTTNCFPTYGSERAALINLWWEAKLREAEESKGASLTKLETVHLRRKLGCDGDSTGTTIDSPCTRGPKNLGLAYGGF